MAEDITKQQAIDLVKSMEVLIGCTGVSVLTKGIEGLESAKVIENTTDYTGKCGTCQWFEREGLERYGGCKKGRYTRIYMSRPKCDGYLST